MIGSKLINWEKIPELTLLSDLSNPPKDLFYRGKWDREIFKNCVAVVGSRKMTDYGRRVIEKLVPQLVFEKKTIVSGFMYGVDQYAHQTCLENGGKTVAILGWGINYPSTSSDEKLAKEIINAGGLILSEWENQRGTLWSFPYRDRIIAALSQEVYVIEAGENSGSLITARNAIKLKRKIFAVPGPITSKVSVGTNMLIDSGMAKMWTGNFNMPINQSTNKINDPILEILENEALTTDELSRKLNKSVSDVGAQISVLLLMGKVVEKGGKYYINAE